MKQIGKIASRSRSQQGWATIGKILTAINLVFAVVLGFIELKEHFGGPSLGGTEEYLFAPPPADGDTIVALMTCRERVINTVYSLRKNGFHDDKALGALHAAVEYGGPFTDDRERDLTNIATGMVRALELRVWNHGGEPARNVELALIGTGSAQISDWPQVDPNREMFNQYSPRISWKNSIPVGTIAAGGERTVRVWSSDIFTFVEGMPIQVVAENGSGKLWHVRKFYGPLAEISLWINLNVGMGRFEIALICLLFLIFAYWWFRGRSRPVDS